MSTAYIIVILRTMCDLLFSSQIQGIVIYSDKEQCTIAEKKRQIFKFSAPYIKTCLSGCILDLEQDQLALGSAQPTLKLLDNKAVICLPVQHFKRD